MSTKKKVYQPKPRKIFKLFGLNVEDKKTPYILFGAVATIWFLCYGLTKWLVAYEARGTFGDLFGSVNALFSGLAFAGIIYTILLQREELAEQRRQLELNRQELELTREEMKLARAESKQQNVTLKRQRFEGTFFKMLDFHFQIVNSVKHEKFSEVLFDGAPTGNMDMRQGKGLDAFDLFIEGYADRMGGPALMQYPVFSTPYNIELKSFLTSVSPYLQSLIAIHRLIDSYTKNAVVRERYMTILRSYISLKEAKFLFYHLILAEDSGVRKQLRIVEKDINVIGTFPVDLLIDPKHSSLRNFYGTN